MLRPGGNSGIVKPGMAMGGPTAESWIANAQQQMGNIPAAPAQQQQQDPQPQAPPPPPPPPPPPVPTPAPAPVPPPAAADPAPAAAPAPAAPAMSMQALLGPQDPGVGWSAVGGTQLNPNLGRGQGPQRSSLKALAGMGQAY